MSTVTYSCDTRAGLTTVTGTAYPEAPGLAIHRDQPGSWTVTHTASGFMLARFGLRRQAKSFLVAVAQILDWTQSRKQIEGAIPHKSDTAQQLRAMAREHGTLAL